MNNSEEIEEGREMVQRGELPSPEDSRRDVAAILLWPPRPVP